MGINLGVALGAAAESGTQSFALFRKMQQDEERLARDRERFDQERERFGREQKTWQEQDASSKLMQQAYQGPDVTGPTDQALNVMTGKDASGQRLTPEARAQLGTQLATLSPEERQAALGAYKSSYYNPEQAYVDAALKAGNQTALKEARASQLTGLQIQGAQQGITKGEYELRGLQRGEERDAAFRKITDDLHQKHTKKIDESNSIAETEGMKGLVNRYGADLKKAYGYDVALVGNNIVLKDAKGKPVGQPISSLSEAKAALQKHFNTEFTSEYQRSMLPLFGSAESLAQHLNKREEIGYKGQEVANQAALVPSTILKNEAAAGASGAMTRATNSMLENREQAAALTAQWDAMSDKDREGPAGQALLQKFNMLNVKAGGTVPLARSSGKGNAAAFKYEVDNLWADTEKKLRGENTPPKDIAIQRADFYAQRGFAPQQAINDLYTGRNGAGEKMTADDLANFKRSFPNTEIDESKLKWLAPKGDGAGTTSDDKDKGYTPVPGSPAAKAQAKRAINAEAAAQAAAQRQEIADRAIAVSQRTQSAVPADRFEQDRKTMSKPELRRIYGNGAGLTDAQYLYLMQ